MSFWTVYQHTERTKTEYPASHKPDGSPPTAVDPRASMSSFLARDFSQSPPPSLSHLLLYPPRFVLECIYGTLHPVAKLDDPSRAARRLALALFAIPRPTRAGPPLLPFFLNSFLPEMLPSIDRQVGPEQQASISCFAALVSWSLLTALRAERAQVDVEKALRQESFSDAMDVDAPKDKPAPFDVLTLSRTLSSRLKSWTGPSGKLLFEKLVAAPNFASNFASFVLAS